MTTETMEVLLKIVLVLSVITFGWLGYILLREMRENRRRKARELERKAFEAAKAKHLADLRAKAQAGHRTAGKLIQSALRESERENSGSASNLGVAQDTSSSSRDSEDFSRHIYSLSNLENAGECSSPFESSSDFSSSCDSSSSSSSDS